jgi:hypothetical protein
MAIEKGKPITIAALDLGYLRTGFAVVRQPGDQVLKHCVIKAEPLNPRKVTEEHRIKRARSAYDGLRLALYHADQDFGPLDALVYEEPQWSMQKWSTSAAAAKALGMALERLYLTLSLVGWARMNDKGTKFEMRPVYKLDPARWQPLFTGVERLPKGQMKRFVKRCLVQRKAEDESFDIGEYGNDEVDAVAIGIVASNLLWLEGEI